MPRTVRPIAALVALALLSIAAVAHGQLPDGPQTGGRPLADVLQDLQRRGLKIIYSSAVVRPDMRVQTDSRATALRRILDDLLAQHGLIARSGPGGTVLVVRDPRARLPKRSALPGTEPPPTSATVTAGDSDDVEATPRFEEAIAVIDTEPGAAVGGPPPLSVRPVDVRALAGGFENVFRTLQALPGVGGTEELGSRIAVRGGSPDQNLTVMDGIEVLNPYRLTVPFEDLAMVGLASTFNPDTIDSVEFFPGAFDVSHGDRLSSLLVVKSREGSEAEAFQGSSSFGLADASVVLEGKLPRRASGSWLVSARRSHIDLVAERAVGVTLPSSQDVHARISFRPQPRQRLSLVGLAGRERTRFGDRTTRDAVHATNARSHLLALTFESSLGSRGSSRTIVSFSKFTDTLRASERSFDNSRGANTADSIATGELLEFDLSREMAVSDLAVRQELVIKASARHWFDLGVEAHDLATRWAWTITGDRNQHQPNGSSIRLGSSLPGVLDSSRDSFRFGAWLQDRWQVAPRLVLQPGLRMERSSLTDQTTLSPRLSGALGLTQALRLDAAVGIHAQNPGYEKVLQSDYFIDLSPQPGSSLEAERALHAVAGLQQDLGAGVSARVATYYRRFSNLLVGQLETDAQRLARLATYDIPAALQSSAPTGPQITTAPLNAGTGRAYGVELSVTGATASDPARISGWATYGLGRADRAAYGTTSPFDYDRRHSLSASTTVRMGPRLDVTATGRWATGLPRTPVRGVRLALVTDTRDADGDGNRQEQVPQRNEAGQPVFQPDLGDVTNINSARLPHFARVDARLTYRPSWGGERWAFHVDLLNVLNGQNVSQIDSALVFDPTSNRPAIVERAQDRGIPFFPSFGIRFWF